MFIKKLFIFFSLLLLSLNVLHVQAADEDNITVNQGELDNYDIYAENSNRFVFIEEEINYENIGMWISYLNLNATDLIMEYIYNIYEEVQYLLVYSPNQYGYLIYDLMLNNAIEYSDNSYNPWYYNEIAVDSVKVYINISKKLYVSGNYLLDIGNNTIVEKNDFFSSLTISSLRCEINIDTVIDNLTNYNSKIINYEYDIDNAFYFKNFFINSDFEFNIDASCTIVAVTLLLSYYDTFVSGNIVGDVVQYEGKNYTTTIKESFDKPYIDYISLQQNYSAGDVYSKFGPTKDFHDYLKEIAIDYCSYDPSEGLTLDEGRQLIEKYAQLNLLNTVNSYYTLNSDVFINVLHNGYPLILGMAGYDYYYPITNSNEIVGKRASLNARHAVIVYGYQDTNLGRFYHCHTGWGSELPSINDTGVIQTAIKGDCYFNPVLIGGYTYMQYNGEHVCSDNFKFEHDNTIFGICPCEPFESYFSYVSCDENLDYFSYAEGKTISYEHVYTEDEIKDERYHYLKCRQYEHCNKYIIQEHEFELIGFYSDLQHYLRCKTCGYQKMENHIEAEYDYNSEYHFKKCSFCLEKYNEGDHLFSYSGNDEEHNAHCTRCNYQLITEDHDVTLSQHSTQNHKYICICGYERYENHNFNSELVCVDCGFEHLQHTYSYTQLNKNSHTKTCLCGEVVLESHNLISSGIGVRCSLCGYFTSDFVVITSYKKEEEEQ